MKHYKMEMGTIFDDCNQTMAFAFADDTPQEEIETELRVVFDAYLCAFSRLLGDPASYTDYREYEEVLDYYVRNTGYKVTPITLEEFDNLAIYEPVENCFLS